MNANLIIVLNDGETYTALQGCTVVAVEGDGDVCESDLKYLILADRAKVGDEIVQEDHTRLCLIKQISHPTDVGL